MRALLKGTILFAALLAASPASAKITFNDVKHTCLPDITEFLGDAPWAGHAYRVGVFNARDDGTYLVRVFFGKGWDLDYGFAPYRHMYALVGIRPLDYVQVMSRFLAVDPLQELNDDGVRTGSGSSASSCSSRGEQRTHRSGTSSGRHQKRLIRLRRCSSRSVRMDRACMHPTSRRISNSRQRMLRRAPRLSECQKRPAPECAGRSIFYDSNRASP
jgi:hypothetical protein